MSSLTAIGNEMKRRLADVQKGYVEKALFGGLMLVLERRGERWRLALARTRTAPSQEEAAIVARDFGLPAGVEWQWLQKKNAKRKVTYYVAECTWVERNVKTSHSEKEGNNAHQN